MVGCSKEPNKTVLFLQFSLARSLSWKKQGRGEMEQPFGPLPPDEDMPLPPDKLQWLI